MENPRIVYDEPSKSYVIMTEDGTFFWNPPYVTRPKLNTIFGYFVLGRDGSRTIGFDVAVSEGDTVIPLCSAEVIATVLRENETLKAKSEALAESNTLLKNANSRLDERVKRLVSRMSLIGQIIEQDITADTKLDERNRE